MFYTTGGAGFIILGFLYLMYVVVFQTSSVSTTLGADGLYYEIFSNPTGRTSDIGYINIQKTDVSSTYGDGMYLMRIKIVMTGYNRFRIHHVSANISSRSGVPNPYYEWVSS